MDGPHGPKGSLVSDGQGDSTQLLAPEFPASLLFPLPALGAPAQSGYSCWDSSLHPVCLSPSPLILAWLLVSRDPKESQDLLDNRALLGPR